MCIDIIHKSKKIQLISQLVLKFQKTILMQLVRYRAKKYSMASKSFFVLIIVTSLLYQGCQRDTILKDPGARLSFSKDTLTFDTVFTSIGSATKYFKVYNRNSQSVILSSVSIVGGAGSQFKINVNGRQGPLVKNIEIRGKDSVYVFVQVLIDPKKDSLLVKDVINFEINGNTQNVKLEAWGQNINLFNRVMLNTQTWNIGNPYVIYDTVKVDSSATLTINQGTIIYFHRKAVLKVYGTLLVNGTLDNPVVFRGDRLDKANYTPPLSYDKIPGQYGGIWITNSSVSSKFNYATIRNGDIGIQVGVLGESGQAVLELANCKIENHSFAGIFAINAKIKAYNCLIDNCGAFTFVGFDGGEYEFYQSTFANFYSLANGNSIPSLQLNNFIRYVVGNDTVKFNADLKKAYFGNCIIAGSESTSFNAAGFPGYQLNYTFDHCLVKIKTEDKANFNKDNFISTQILPDENPGFKSIEQDKCDFALTLKSIYLRQKGDTAIALLYPFDYNGISRLNGDHPDLGAFQFVNSNSGSK
jgi:hypothetical protein